MAYTLKLNGQTVKQVFVVGEHRYGYDSFCIINKYNGTNTCTLTRTHYGQGFPPSLLLQYSYNEWDWTEWVADSNGNRTVSIPQGGTLYIRGGNENGLSYDYPNRHSFECSQEYDVSGRLMSLVNGIPGYSDEFYVADGAFCGLFAGSNTLYDASGLIFPDDGVRIGTLSFSSMFLGSSVVYSPLELPKTDLTNANNVYAAMFQGCSYLLTSPEIKAQTLYASSLSEMFYGCSSLNRIKVNFTQWSPSNSTDDWTYGVANEGTFVCPSSLPLTRNPYPDSMSYDRIPENWTIDTF